jgi:hypothetical protein
VAIATRDLLAIPAVEVNIERLFSQGRDILGIRRMGLDSKTMRIIILLKAHFDQMDKKKAEVAKKKQAFHQSVYGVSLEATSYRICTH